MGAARKVGELMSPNVVCLSPDTRVDEAERLLAERRVGGAPVVDADGKILGIVTQHDLVQHASQRVTVAEAGRFFTTEDDLAEIGSMALRPEDTPVEEVMTRKIYTVSRGDGVAVAANIMRERKIHRVLVTERGRLVGILTSLDLLRVIEEPAPS